MTAERLRVIALLAITLGFLLAWAFPIVWSVLNSLKTDPTCSPIRRSWFSSRRWRRIATFCSDPARSCRTCFQLVISVGTTIVTMLMAIPAAYVLGRLRFRGKRFAGFYVLATQMLPPVGIIIPYFLVLRNVGWIDTYQGIILIYLSFSLPFAIWLLVSYFEDIPLEMEEAAYLDGASRLRTLWRIILPQVRGGIAVTVVFVFLNAWNEFLFAVVSAATRFARSRSPCSTSSRSSRRCGPSSPPSRSSRCCQSSFSASSRRSISSRVSRSAPSKAEGADERSRSGRFREYRQDAWHFRRTERRDFEIKPGEFFALLGPSGSGKTTTLRILAGSMRRRRAASSSTATTSPSAGAGPRHRDGVPELRAVPAHDRGREHRLSARDGEAAEGRNRAAVQDAARR